MVTSKMEFLTVFRNQKISDMKNFQLEKIEVPKIPQELRKEISILKELGLEDYEIEYLIYLKTKQIAGHKWE